MLLIPSGFTEALYSTAPRAVVSGHLVAWSSEALVELCKTVMELVVVVVVTGIVAAHETFGAILRPKRVSIMITHLIGSNVHWHALAK